ncbi:hypothetical protein C2G38_2044278 [Gigaspora rosea]|uniref:Uncharacterized protein n=1 Tax=Gigaspora rosea TaxID=44941 RepID=A0A397UL49_9GLOM|nr:hypothetical protein C2G38_2044278 [Gigaspora rosea]
MSTCMQKYLEAISRMHKEKGLKNLVEDFRIREVVRGIKLLKAQDRDMEWPWDPFPLEALKRYHDNPLEKVDLLIWYKNLALVVIGFCTMRRPEELYNLILKYVEKRSG